MPDTDAPTTGAGGQTTRERLPVTSRPAGGHERRPSRPDVQGLRAVAVLLVLLYHLRPEVLPGGFVGVDVFFVISGFLIVGSLGREAVGTGRISLRGFYARRIRRLLPASTLVLLVVMAATVVLMPFSRWEDTAEGLVTSALQVQNWALAAGTGYAEATRAVSPLQHYWSLAVEEQFYLVVPVLLLVLCRVADRARRSRRAVVLAGTAALAAASFLHSVTFSAADHDVAYFATTTRMWELLAGGLLALGGDRLRGPGWLRNAAGWIGLACIGWSALTFSTSMDFPGSVAALPVAGTLAVLYAGTGRAGTAAPAAGPATRLLSTRPATYVGDVSYSLYLWHWPVIVFFGFYVAHPPTALQCAVLLAGSLVLAHLSTHFVERPFRSGGALHRPGRPRSRRGHGTAYRLAAALVAIAVLTGLGPWLYVQHRQTQLSAQQLDSRHPGGASVVPEQLPTHSDVPVIPDPAVATDGSEYPFLDKVGCPVFDLRAMKADACVYGDTASPVTVVLTGDSHAEQFSTPLNDIAVAQGWRFQSMARTGCPFSASMPISPENMDVCSSSNALVRDEILRSRPDVVVTADMQPRGYERWHGWRLPSLEEQAAGYRDLWRPIVDAGIRLVVIRDTPSPSSLVPECVERNGPYSPACQLSRAQAADDAADPVLLAARQLPGVDVVDLTDHMCNSSVCPAVVGNVLVYRDNHITDTFARSLTGPLMRALGVI